MRAVSVSTLLALGLATQQAAATGWLDAESFSCPSNTNNKCTPKQQGGLDFEDQQVGFLGTYGDLNWENLKCSNGLSKRTFSKSFTGGKCASGKASKDVKTSPKFSCGASQQGISIDHLYVSTSVEIDLEFHYGYESGQTCKQIASCSTGGSVIENSQCGGAKSVTVKLPDYVSESDCEVGIHSVGFDCGPASSTLPIPSSTFIYMPPVGTSKPYISKPIYTTPAINSTTPARPTIPGSAPVSSSPPIVTTPIPTTSNSPATTTSAAGTTVPLVTTEIVVTTLTTCPVTNTVTSSSSTSIHTTSTISTIFITSTSTVCTKCIAPPTSVPPGSSTPLSSSLGNSPQGSTSSPAPVPTVPATTQEIVTTEIVATTVTTCPVTNTITSGSTTSLQTTTTISTIEITSTSTVCTKCLAPSPPPASGSPSSPAIPSSAPAPPASSLPAPCPNVLPSCMKTWITITTCKDTSDSNCYCQDAQFTKTVQECVSAWAASDLDIQGALSNLAGICAPHVYKNPGIITNVPKTITLVPTPATPVTTSPPAVGTSGVLVTPPASQVLATAGILGNSPVGATSPPAGAPHPVTVLSLSTTVTSSCPVTQITDGQVQAPMSSICSSVINTQVTVPQVGFTTAPGASGSSSPNVGLAAGSPAPVPATPTPTPGPNGNSPIGVTTFGTIVGSASAPVGSTKPGSSPIPFVGGASSNKATIFGIVAALVGTLFLA